CPQLFSPCLAQNFLKLGFWRCVRSEFGVGFSDRGKRVALDLANCRTRQARKKQDRLWNLEIAEPARDETANFTRVQRAIVPNHYCDPDIFSKGSVLDAEGCGLLNLRVRG